MSDHELVLARISGGSAYWDLRCNHGTDTHWYTYANSDDPDEPRFHHDECILQPWLNEAQLDMVADMEGPLVTPIPVDAEWHGDYWTLHRPPDA